MERIAFRKCGLYDEFRFCRVCDCQNRVSIPLREVGDTDLLQLMKVEQQKVQGR